MTPLRAAPRLISAARPAAGSKHPIPPPKSMPAAETSIVISYLILAVGGAAPLLFGRQDAFTICGAMASVFMVVLQLQGKPRGERRFLKAAPTIVSGMICGTLLPGFVLKGWFPALIPFLSWEAYTIFGFVAGLSGQRIISWLTEFIDKRAPDFLDRVVSLFLGMKPHHDDDDKKPKP